MDGRTGKRPYTCCEGCKKNFAQSFARIKHEMTHTRRNRITAAKAVRRDLHVLLVGIDMRGVSTLEKDPTPAALKSARSRFSIMVTG